MMALWPALAIQRRRRQRARRLSRRAGRHHRHRARLCGKGKWMQQLTMNRASTWRAANGVLERECIVGELGKITAPTLVMVGDEDTSTPKALADRVVSAISPAKLIVIPGAGHGSTL